MFSKKVNLDETDHAILAEVVNNARISVADIARSVGVQRDTVKYRIERFEKRGLIMKYNTIIDPQSLGCEVFMLVLIKTAPVAQADLQVFIDGLKAHKNVTHAARMVGNYDYFLQMAANDIADFDRALDEVKKIQPGVITEIELANLIDGVDGAIKVDDFSGLV